ncbi:MAG TPA: hypothetical protein DCM05_15755 [Elusimicrobia bacterium]|nr:hypothetical protein [Elusimicrobiota bacterium]
MAYIYSVLAVLLFSFQPSAAAQNFDQGVEVKPVLEKAREGAAKLLDATPAASSSESKDEFVWVTLDKTDVAALKGEFGFPSRKAGAVGAQASMYKLSVGELDRLAEVMNRKFRRTGFMTFRAEAEARQAVFAPDAVAAPKAYSIDMGKVVEPMVKLVDEAPISKVTNTLAAYKNRYYRSATGAASSRWLADHWKGVAQGRDDVGVELFPHQGWDQPSVIATVRGSKTPGEIVVLGGHIDSIAGYGADTLAPGADDNASGVAVVTEALRVLVKAGYRPSKTLKFVAYSAEEVGLRGSKDVANSLKGQTVLGALNFDMANYNGSSEDILFITDSSDASLNAFLGKLLSRYAPDVKWASTSCGYACSDHASWTRIGVPSSFPFEAKMNEDNPNIHSAKDTLSQIGGKSDHAAKFAKLAVAAMAELAK